MCREVQVTDLLPPDDPEAFFLWLRRTSEQSWVAAAIEPSLYGFQTQPGTQWRPGLTPEQVRQYQADIGFEFPVAYRRFLQHMNGTTPPTINVYGGCGEPPTYGTGYYSYPTDLAVVRAQIDWIYESFELTAEEVEHRKIPHILPIVGHRFLVVDRCRSTPVLSMHGADVIVYATSLEAFLIKDIFRQHQAEERVEAVSVEFWLRSTRDS